MVLEGRCYEREAVAYKAMDNLVDHLSQYWRQLAPAEAAQILPGEAALLPRLFPVLGRVAVVAEAPAVAPIVDRQELRTRAFAAMRELLQRLATVGPLVLWLDDLHWVDANTEALLADLMRAPEAPPLLLVVSSRPEGDKILESLLRSLELPTDRIDLEPLPDEAAVALSKELVGLDDALALRVAREAHGNPFFIGALAQHVRRAAESPQLGELRLEQVLGEHIARLPDAARSLLEVVALAGEPVTRRVASTAARLSAADLAREASSLRGLGLLRLPGGRASDRIEVYHDQIRLAVIAGLAPAGRRTTHRGLALAYEQWGEASPERSARHWHGAGEAARAAPHALRAAEEAFTTLDFDRAADLYMLTLAIGAYSAAERSRLQRALGEALAHAGRPPEAVTHFLAAAEGADAATRLELRRRSAEELLKGGFVEEGQAAIRSVLDEIGLGQVKATPLRAVAALLFRRAWLRLRGLGFRRRSPSEVSQRALAQIDGCWSVSTVLGYFDTMKGAEFHSRHLLLALRVGEPRRVALALMQEACYLAVQGADRRARQVLALACSEAALVDDPYVFACGSWARAFMAYFLDSRWREALAHVSDSQSRFRAHCQTGGWELDTVSLYACFCHLYLGNLEELGRLVPSLLREAARRGDGYMAINLRTRIVLPWLVRDQPERAELDLEEAIASWMPSLRGFQLQHFYALHSRCELELYRGAPHAAATHMHSARHPLARSLLLQLPLVRIEVLYLRARIALALGAAAEGSQRAHHARTARACARTLRREKAPFGRALGTLITAGAANLLGDRPSTIAALEESGDQLRSLEMALHAAAADRRLGETLGSTDDAAGISGADAWLTRRGVKNSPRLVALLIPGWPDPARRTSG